MGASVAAGTDGLPLARVLVVEDDAGCREVLASVLTDEGYSVECVPNGQAALAALGRAGNDAPPEPHVVLLDLRMPGMDGAEFARQYRSRPGRHVPIVLMTASQALGEALDSVQPDAFVPKPFEIDELLARLEAVLKGR